MKMRSLGPGISACAALALLVSCSPPAAELPQAPVEAPVARAAQPETPAPAAKLKRRERRPDSAALAEGQYKYIDERGQLRLASRLEDIPERQRATASQLVTPSASPSTRPPTDDARARRDVDVTIYTTRSCGYCRAAIAHFDKLGIDYVNRDVEEDEEARAEYLGLTDGRRGVPVIVVGDAWIQGWSRAEFDRLLASAR